ncbi:hypothetical protein TRVA0_003S01464 [Trichomonascus vanleenenianus]|uniref:uncharacterized protein n=1 Tax=Trichomonascus vanleenenianus TaxID=2268995 RepID=UPI003ECABE38
MSANTTSFQADRIAGRYEVTGGSSALSFTVQTPESAATNTVVPNANGSVRPYRSRRNRPCDLCRRRKTRCDMLPEGTCAMCKKIGGSCTFVAEPAKKVKREFESPRPGGGVQKRPSYLGSAAGAASSAAGAAGGGAATSTTPRGGLAVPQPKKTLPRAIDVPPFQPPPRSEAPVSKEPPLVPEGFDSGALLGLSGDQDPYLLQYFVYDEYESCTFIKHAVRRVRRGPALPVQFIAIKDAEREQRYMAEVGAQRKRIYDKVGRYEERLLALYFRFAFPTYPIVDQESFYHDYYYNKENINVGLLAGLLALSCIWWKYDSLLCVNVMPKNLSQELYEECAIALEREARYPTVASVQCLLLLLQRRLQPSETAETYAMTADIARLVALSHNLGLHLDPSDWSIDERKKALRKRLWATVYIMEKWTAVNTGRPSLLHWDNSTMDCITSDEPSSRLFVYMVSLTRLLDEIAHELYSVRHHEERYYDVDRVRGRVDEYFQRLENWRENLPSDLRDMAVAPEGEFCKNGTLNLAALTVEVLLHRIRLRPLCSRLISKPLLHLYRAHAAETIQRIIKFTSEISHSHLHAFWYSTTRLNFSTLAHFVYFHHITSPTKQEFKDTREMLRKWLFALRVLAQGWEEGTGLAALRMDTVFWMGTDLFDAENTPGLCGDYEEGYEKVEEQEIESIRFYHPNSSHSSSHDLNKLQSDLPPPPSHPQQLSPHQHSPHPHSPHQHSPHLHSPHLQSPHPQSPHPHSPHQHSPYHNSQPQPLRRPQSSSQQMHQQQPQLPPQSSMLPCHNGNPSHGSNGNESNGNENSNVNFLQYHQNFNDLDHGMLLLNEDIMPQEEQTHLLEEDVPPELAGAYADYFAANASTQHDYGAINFPMVPYHAQHPSHPTFYNSDLHDVFQNDVPMHGPHPPPY